MQDAICKVTNTYNYHINVVEWKYELAESANT